MKIAFLADTRSIHAQRWIKSLKKDYEILLATPTQIRLSGIRTFEYNLVRPRVGLDKFVQRVLSGPLILLLTFFNNQPFSLIIVKFLSKFGFSSYSIYQKIIEFKPDLIHIHYLSRWDDTLAALILPKEKLIVSVWGDDIEDQVGRQSFLVKKVRRKVLQRAQLVTATSGYLAELTYNYSGKTVFPWIVPFGVNLNKFKPSLKEQKKIIIGFIKPTDWVYGSDILLKTLKELLRKIDFELWVVGKDTDDFRKSARRLGLGNKIKYFGQVSHGRVSQLIPQLSVILLPSRFETFGVSAVEAQACGVPIVASAVGGLREVVKDKETGLLVSTWDHKDFSNALKQVLSERNIYSKRSRLWAEVKFDWLKNVSLMKYLYNSILGNSNQVAMVVTNSIYLDNRVKKEALGVEENNNLVTVFGMLEPNEKLPLWEMYGKVRIVRIPKDVSLSEGGPRAFFKKSLHLPEILIYGGASLRKLHKVIDKFPASVFHAHDLDTLLVSALAAHSQRAKLIYDSHEFFIEAMTDSINEKMRNKKVLQLAIILLIKINLSLVERAVIGRADRVITVSKSISKHLSEKYSLRKKPVIIMNAWERFLVPTETDKFRKILKIQQNNKIIIYQGGIIEGRGLEALVRSVANLPSNLVLVFLGYGKLLPHLKELTKKLRLENRVFFLDVVSASELMDYTSSADIGVITLEATNLNNVYAMPNKLFEYIAAGLAIIVPDYPDMSEVANKGCGLVFRHDDWDDLVNKIVNVSQEKTLSKMKVVSRSLFEREYNWEIEKQKLQKLYKEVLS